MQSYLSFRFCLRSDHLPFFSHTTLVRRRFKAQPGSRPGCWVGCQRCQSMPALAVGFLGLTENKWLKKTCRWSNSRNFQRCMMLDDVAWDIQFSRPAADVTHLPLSRHCWNDDPTLSCRSNWAWKSQVQSPRHEIHPIHTKHESILWHYKTVYEAYILLGLPYAVRILGWCIPLAWD